MPDFESLKPFLVLGLALGGVFAMSGVGVVVLYHRIEERSGDPAREFSPPLSHEALAAQLRLWHRFKLSGPGVQRRG